MTDRIQSLFRGGHRGRATVGLAAGMALALVVGVAALLAFSAGTSGPASATDVTPTLVLGNADCASQGGEDLIKIEPVMDGTFPLPGGGTITLVVQNSHFDWTSTVGIGFILVKGGRNANLYVYDPPAPATADTGLHAPQKSNNNGKFFGLSHISFCDPGDPPDTPTPTPTPTPTITVTPEREEEKCEDRKGGCPTPEPKVTPTPSGDPEPPR